MTFGNLRANAQLWRRFLRELRFSHWEPAVPLPRMPAAGAGEGNVCERDRIGNWRCMMMMMMCRSFRSALVPHDCLAEHQEQPCTVSIIIAPACSECTVWVMED